MHASSISQLNWYSVEAAAWLSLFAAPLGALLVFRRLSFFGDAMGHASLVGVALVFLTLGFHPVWLAIAVFLSVLVAAGLFSFFETKAKLPADVALTVSYTGLFALGSLLMGRAEEVDFEHILLGDIWSIDHATIWFLRIWGPLVLGLIIIFWRPFWASVMDPHFARGLGYRDRWVDFGFLSITAVSVSGMIQSVGVILLAAYLVLPVATILPWAKGLKALVILSAVAALASSGLGLFLSERFGSPTGPSIAFSGFCFLLLSHGLHLVCKSQKSRGSYNRAG